MKILVTGDRNWTDIAKVAAELEQFPAGTILVHGAARGADTIAGLIGEELGFEVRPYPANWNEYHKAAGAIRNREMWEKEGPFDLVLAFHSNLAESKGTKNMVGIVTKAGNPIKLIV